MKITDVTLSTIITDGINLCQKELSLDEIPPSQIIDNESSISHSGKNSFGMFDGNTIWVVSKNRHPIDIVRTLAHELTHWKQKLEGAVMDGSDGSDVENEANAVAGVIMRKFSERYPDYFLESIPR